MFDELPRPTYNEIVNPPIQDSKGNKFQNDAATIQGQFLQLLSSDDSIEEEDATKFKEVSNDEVLVRKLERSKMVLGIMRMNTLGMVTMNFSKSVLRFNLDGDKASREELIMDVKLQELLEYFEYGIEPTRFLFVQGTGYNIVFDPGGKSIIDGGNNSVVLGRDGVVSNAGISDTIEEEWFAMNRFEGHIPLGWNDATQVYLQINSFPGSVPNNIAELMRRLHTLFLFYNRIRGKLPALICKMKRMEFLFVGQNIIIAQLPDCWNDLRSLKVIDASNISLYGGILNPLISSYLLIVLMLGDNGLRRNISFSLCGCRQVSWIYVLLLRSNLLEGINIFTQSKTWYQFQAVLRVSLEIFLFFGIRALIMIGVRDQNDRRDSWHHGGWTTKIVVWILLVLLVFFLLSLVITVSETLSEFCATLHFRGNDSLLHAVVISIYCAFVCYMSLASEPRDYVCSGLQYKSSIVSKGTLIIETLKRILSVIYSELRVGSLTPFLALSPSSRASSIPLILSSMTLLNHVMLSYNNWSRRIPTRNQPQMLNDSSNYEDSSPPTLFFQDVDPKDKLWLYLRIITAFIVELGSVCGTLEIVALKAPSFGKHKSQYLVSTDILIVGIVMGDEVEVHKITLEVIGRSMRMERLNPFKVLEVLRNHFQVLVLQEFDPFFSVHFDGAMFQMVFYKGILHTYPILNLEDKVLFEGGNVMDMTNITGYGQPSTTSERTTQQLNQQPNMGP